MSVNLDKQDCKDLVHFLHECCTVKRVKMAASDTNASKGLLRFMDIYKEADAVPAIPKYVEG